MKLVIATITSLALGTAAFACPNMDHEDNATPKTAEKAKAKDSDAAKAKDQPTQPKSDAKDQKAPTKTAKDAKKGDKVSLK